MNVFEEYVKFEYLINDYVISHQYVDFDIIVDVFKDGCLFPEENQTSDETFALTLRKYSKLFYNEKLFILLNVRALYSRARKK